VANYDFLIANLGALLLLSTLAGLLVQRRARYCRSFFAYLSATTTFQLLIVYWPETFFVFTFYSMKETVLFVLKSSVALEIWRRSFSPFPRARIRVGFLLAGATLLTAVAAHTLPDDMHPYDILVGVLLPRLQAGLVLLYAIVVCAAAWYRVPIHPLHWAILLGFAGFLTVNSLLLSFVGWHRGAASTFLWVGRLNAAAYVLAELWWCAAAWRRPRQANPILFRLQPWADSW
jgi:hypothetical protein